MRDDAHDGFAYLENRQRLDVVERIDPERVRADPSFRSVVRSIASELDASDVHICLVGEVGVRRVASHGFQPNARVLDTCRCRRLVASKQILITEDADTDPRLGDCSDARHGRSVGFYAGLPVLVHQHAVGALCVTADEPRSLEVEQRAALFGWLARIEAQLAFHVECVGSASRSSQAEDAQQAAALRESRRKQMLLSHMLHGAINTASSAHSDALYIRAIGANLVAGSDVDEALADIHVSLTRLCDTLRNARSLVSSNVGQVESSTAISLRTMIEDVIGFIEEGGGEKGIRVVIYADEAVDRTRVDPDLLKDCLNQLVHLSMDASREHSELRIRITGDERRVRAELNFDGNLEEAARDISVDALDAYASASTSTGQALDFCSMVAEAHDGDLNVFRYETSSSLVLELPSA